MKHLLCIGVWMMASFSMGFAHEHVIHCEQDCAAHARPVIYLFGETHGTEEADNQEWRLRRVYAEGQKAVVASEAIFFELDSLKNLSIDKDIRPNIMGCESAPYYGLMTLGYSLLLYYNLQDLNSSGTYPGYYKAHQKASDEATSTLTSYLFSLLDPGSAELFNYLAAQPELVQNPCFEKLMDRRAAIVKAFRQDGFKFGTQLKRSALIQKKASFGIGSVNQVINFLKLVGAHTLAYLAKIELPDGSKPSESFINECHKILEEGADKGVAPEDLLITAQISDMRDQHIAHNLERMYPLVQQRGLLLAGIYGSNHLPSLKAKLEAKGFDVVVDDWGIFILATHRH